MTRTGPRQRWAILGSLLAATVAAAWFVSDDPAPEETASTAPRRPQPSAAAASAALTAQPVALAGLKTGKNDGDADMPRSIDPFRSKSWYTAPPPPPAPKPKAPPLPFKYLGQLVEDGAARTFVSHGGRNLVIKAGDVLDGLYAVEEVAAGQIAFIYLPLNERQVLPQ